MLMRLPPYLTHLYIPIREGVKKKKKRKKDEGSFLVYTKAQQCWVLLVLKKDTGLGSTISRYDHLRTVVELVSSEHKLPGPGPTFISCVDLGNLLKLLALVFLC